MNCTSLSSAAAARPPRRSLATLGRFALIACAGLAVTPAAHAGVITFENMGDGSMFDHAFLAQDGLLATGINNAAEPGQFDLVGAVVNGAAPMCFGYNCTTNNMGHYYAGLSDSSLLLSNAAGTTLQLASFDASAITPNAGLPAGTVSMLNITGIRADRSVSSEDLILNGRGADGFTFQHFDLDKAFTSQQFTAVSFSGFSCSADAPCVAQDGNFGQFALDNITTIGSGVPTSAVPEPSACLMMGLGVLAIVAAARRMRPMAGGARVAALS
ncbi:MAG TPA: NF038120 family PEP-CTERM protein [Janthinobacterium sp.]|nr:NF038120 family PEP-CTERM protein [Janthinobacterium sp.]